MGAIALDLENITMSSIGRREARPYVDFSAVPPGQWKMHDRLENWARWCRSRESVKATPMFELYRSSEARRAYGEETSVPVDKLDAVQIAKGVASLPDKHCRSLQWCYVRPCRPASMARELGLSLEGLAAMVQDARQMLINRRA